MSRKWFVFIIALALILGACQPAAPDTIKIGINAPLTGDIPKVGEGTKYAAEMWLEDINAAGGLDVGGKKYQVELVIEDNESKAESAAAANTKLITQDEVLVIVGPQSSKQAVPAGGVANDNRRRWSARGPPTPTPPWTGPGSSAPRSWIPSRGRWWPTLSPTSSASPRPACCTTSPATIPRAWPSSSSQAWEDIHGAGSVVAYESFTTGTPTSAPS